MIYIRDLVRMGFAPVLLIQRAILLRAVAIIPLSQRNLSRMYIVNSALPMILVFTLIYLVTIVSASTNELVQSKLPSESLNNAQPGNLRIRQQSTIEPPGASISAGEEKCDLAWLQRLIASVPKGTWVELADTEMRDILLKKDDPLMTPAIWGYRGSTAVITAWNGGAFDGCNWYFTGGGHLAYGGNEIYRFNLQSLSWVRLTNPTPYVQGSPENLCPGIEDKDLPVATHTYDGFVFSPLTQSLLLWGHATYCDEWVSFSGARAGDPDTGRDQLWEFNPATHGWAWINNPADTWYSPKSAVDPKSGRIYLCRSRRCWDFDPRTGKYERETPMPFFEGRFGHGSAAFDPVREQIVIAGYEKIFAVSSHGALSMGRPRLVREGSEIGNLNKMGIVYHPKRDLFILWSGDRSVYTLDPENWMISEFRGSGTKVPIPATEGVYSRWAYIEDIDVFIGMDNVDQGFWLFALPDGPGTSVDDIRKSN